MNSLKYKQELASHVRNRKEIRKMFQEKNIQMLPQTPQLLSEMKEKPLNEEKQSLFDSMKDVLKQIGYQEFRYINDGQQGYVFLAKKTTNKRFAIKGISFRNSDGSTDQEKYDQAQQEKEILLRCRGSPYVSNLINVIEGQRFIFLILTECQGTLQELIDTIPSKKLNELSAIKYSRDIAQGLHYIHSKSCIVNDLKFDNILIDYNGNAVISDFGFSQALPKISGYSLKEYMGNFQFQAPECYDPTIFPCYSDEYKKLNIQTQTNPSQRSEACSFGYLIYTMIQGFNNNLTFIKHKPLQYDQNFQSFKYIKQLRNIIDGLTQFVPRERLQLEEALISLIVIVRFEFQKDQLGLISEETRQGLNQLYEKIEYIENFGNMYYPIIETSVLKSIEEEVQNQQGQFKDYENQIYYLQENQVEPQGNQYSAINFFSQQNTEQCHCKKQGKCQMKEMKCSDCEHKLCGESTERVQPCGRHAAAEAAISLLLQLLLAGTVFSIFGGYWIYQDMTVKWRFIAALAAAPSTAALALLYSNSYNENERINSYNLLAPNLLYPILSIVMNLFLFFWEGFIVGIICTCFLEILIWKLGLTLLGFWKWLFFLILFALGLFLLILIGSIGYQIIKHEIGERIYQMKERLIEARKGFRYCCMCEQYRGYVMTCQFKCECDFCKK